MNSFPSPPEHGLPDYWQITHCTEQYFDRFGDSPLGVGWPTLAGAERRYEVMLEVIKPQSPRPVELLDFGCGAGHLLEHLQRRQRNEIHYTGLDLSPRFIQLCRQKFPQQRFYQLDILATEATLPQFDYAVINGVFTSKRSLTFSQMFQFVQQVLIKLFSQVRYGLAFNAISPQVDWERWDLFHLPLDRLAHFLCHHLSRNFVIRNDYGLYEFTTYVYK